MSTYCYYNESDVCMYSLSEVCLVMSRFNDIDGNICQVAEHGCQEVKAGR